MSSVILKSSIVWVGPNVVNEPGLYSLILTSRKPEAKTFKRWITHEVILTIRKYGIYATDKAIEMSLQDHDYLIGILQTIKEEREKNRLLLLQNEQQKEVITVLEPKAEYVYL